MGMDVYGRNATSEKGRYFRSNIWGWPGILDAIAETGVLPEDMLNDMAYNIGAGPSMEQSIALADALDAKLASMPPSGTFISEDSKYANIGTATVAKEITRIVPSGEFSLLEDTDFSTTVEDLREFAEFCRDSGGFEVW